MPPLPDCTDPLPQRINPTTPASYHPSCCPSMHNGMVYVKTAISNVPNPRFCMHKQVSLIYVGGGRDPDRKKVKQKWSEKGSPTASSRTSSGDVVSTRSKMLHSLVGSFTSCLKTLSWIIVILENC